MKESLSHLPKHKRDELKRIVEVIRKKATQTEMVILFGSHARGDWVEDVYTEGHITYEYKSDFDILVIVQAHQIANSTTLWGKVENRIHELRLHTWTTLIVHNIEYINKRLEEGQYFFSDIQKEGILLYDSGNLELAEPRELDSAERARIAKENFEQWFENADDFYDQFEYALKKQKYKIAAFLLHQATECYYHTIILVFTGYKPKLHDIEKLGHMAASHDPAFLPVFPKATPEQEHCFKLLKKAYVDARYKKDYKITPEELEYLSARVRKLRDLTKKICKKKIESFV